MMRSLLAALLAISPAFAAPERDEAGPTMGAQFRLSFPASNLKDATGSWPGLGGSLLVEQPFEDGYAVRVGLGFDHFMTSDWAGRPDVRGQVDLGRLDLEGIKLLRPDEEPFDLGPYLLLGISALGWSITETDQVLGTQTTHRIVHVGGSAGLGWRLSRKLSLEMKGTFGKVAPTFGAGLLSFAVTYHF